MTYAIILELQSDLGAILEAYTQLLKVHVPAALAGWDLIVSTHQEVPNIPGRRW